VIIARRYSYHGGEDLINNLYPDHLKEIESVILAIDAEACRLKKPEGKEINRAKRIGVDRFYSPKHLNALFDWHLFRRGWDLKPRIYTKDITREGYREMDALKDKLGVEIQFGKYSFLTYDIVAKMVIFKNLGVIDYGIEICPMASMLPHLSSGIGAFEQVIWDLKYRGTTDSDVPVLVLGIESEALYTDRLQREAAIPQQPSLFGDTDAVPEEPIVELMRYKQLTEETLNRVQDTGADVIS
jgi:hypothetical protein